jgi:hypothetical protein
MTRRQLLAALALSLSGTIGLIDALANGEVREIGGRRVIVRHRHLSASLNIRATLQPR